MLAASAALPAVFPALASAQTAPPAAAPAASPAIAPAASPSSTALTAQPAPAESAASNRISIDVEVSDKQGQPVRGLQASDFTVLDNNQPVNPVEFHAIEALGTSAGNVHVVIVVDTINTGVLTAGREREQLTEFLKQGGGELSNPSSIAILSERGLKAAKGSTRDGNQLLASLDQSQSELRIEGRSAGFYGAADRLQQSLSQLGQLASFEATQPGRKLLLFISPGWPLFAGAGFQEDTKQRTWVFNTLVDLTNGLREAHVALYTLDPFNLGRTNPFYYQNYLKPITKISQAEYPYLGLQVLSEHTGGLVFVTGNDIKGEINRAIQDASAYYALTFASAAPTEKTEYHALQVKVDKPGVTVRTSAGYYVKANP
jgi:VWFA-related protein